MIAQQLARPETKAELLDRIESSWAALEDTLSRYPEERLTGRRDPAGWSAKDHLANLAAWERSMLFLLQGLPRHEGLGVDEALYRNGSEDQINAAIHARTRGDSLAAVRAAFAETHRQLLALLDRLDDADLHKTYSDYLPDEPGEERGEPIMRRIAANTCEHYDQHRRWIEALIG